MNDTERGEIFQRPIRGRGPASALLALCLLLSNVASAELGVPSGRYALDPTHAYITFSYSHLGFSTPHLGFNQFDVTLDLDAAQLERSKLQVAIAADSIDSRVAEFDEHLRSPDYFDVAQFPEIRFAATNITLTDKNSGTITGDLTIKGVSKPLTLQAKIERAAMHPLIKKPVLGVSAEGKLLRGDWGLGKYLPAVGNEVTLFITAELVLQESQ